MKVTFSLDRSLRHDSPRTRSRLRLIQRIFSGGQSLAANGRSSHPFVAPSKFSATAAADSIVIMARER